MRTREWKKTHTPHKILIHELDWVSEFMRSIRIFAFLCVSVCVCADNKIEQMEIYRNARHFLVRAPYKCYCRYSPNE